jgi:hypothetical protein
VGVDDLMATSGTTVFNPDLLEIIEEAYEQAGMELRGGYQLATARRSLDLLLLEWANRGIHMWAMDNGTVALVDGTTNYNLPTDTVDLLQVYVTAGSTDYQLRRIDVSTYSNLSTKTTEARPTMYFINRVETPVIYLYPTPDQSYTLNYWRMRRLEDTGDFTNTADVNYKFLPALISGLAFHLACKNRNNEVTRASIGEIKAEYDRQFIMATEEDRDRSSMFLRPRVAI